MRGPPQKLRRHFPQNPASGKCRELREKSGKVGKCREMSGNVGKQKKSILMSQFLCKFSIVLAGMLSKGNLTFINVKYDM